MAAETARDFKEYPQACTWADRRTGKPQSHRHEHYLNLSRSATELTPNQCGSVEQCALTAIERDASILANRQASLADRLEALKFLSHWLADIHQPLHVAFADDRGGNAIKVKHSTACRAKNLHAFWDRCLIRHRLKQRGLRYGDSAAYAEALNQSIKAHQKQLWREGLSDDWANESLLISRQPALGYCVQTGLGCQYSFKQVRYNAYQPKRVLTLSAAYLVQFAPLAEQRIQQAGIRLAYMLDRLLD